MCLHGQALQVKAGILPIQWLLSHMPEPQKSHYFHISVCAELDTLPPPYILLHHSIVIKIEIKIPCTDNPH